MIQPIRTFGIERKEWRRRPWTLATVAAAAVILPYFESAQLGAFLPTVNSTPGFVATGLICGICATPALLSLILGATLWGGDEHDPARAFLYLVPVSRGAILRAKLRVLALQVACPVVIAMVWLYFTMAMNSPVHNPDPSHPFRLFALAGESATVFIELCLVTIVFSALAATLGAIVQLYCRSFILTLALGFILTAPLLGMLIVDPFARQDFHLAICLAVLGRAAAVLAALVAWLFYLFCRSAIQEREATPRAALALLFGAVLIEAAATVIFCNPRDLVFIIFGV